ncbi:hypothetical protein [Sphingomonas bacterium]|uniref:hypothetical protein n=1 Tax=Sphingomonas bacterium TaxID=1895847 RepID=UPI00157644C9|nr:hypothetical protein [Sphingomonas bacterium]
MSLALALLLQAAPVTSASAAPPPAFSILDRSCASAQGRDVVVCGRAGDPYRLPMPDDAPPTPGYVKPDSRDPRDNHGMAAACATQIGGCPILTEPPLVYKAIGAGIRAIGDARKTHRWARAKAADGDRRQAIDLGEAAPAGR